MQITAVRALAALADPDVVAMIVSASADRELCDLTYLPYEMDPSEAVNWASNRPGLAWVLYGDGRPVGWWEIEPIATSCGFTFPAGSWEQEMWLIPDARGQRLMHRSTELLRPQLIEHGVSHLVGIAWKDNTSSVTSMYHAGFEILGEGWWGADDGTGGVCIVGVLTLAGR